MLPLGAISSNSKSHKLSYLKNLFLYVIMSCSEDSLMFRWNILYPSSGYKKSQTRIQQLSVS
jgi:hypothetical protein